MWNLIKFNGAWISLLLLIAVNSQAQTKIIHENNRAAWENHFSGRSRFFLDRDVTDGLITRTGNTYHTIIIDTSFYVAGVSWEQLEMDVPMYGYKFFAFKNGIAQDPIAFYATEIEIKFVAGVKTVTVTPFDDPFSNLDNNDLSGFFNNDKTFKSKKIRQDKLKEKKDKQK